MLTQGNTQVVQTRITDPSGVAALGVVPRALGGTYSVQAFFGPGGPTPPTLSADLEDTASSASGASLTVNRGGRLVDHPRGATPRTPALSLERHVQRERLRREHGELQPLGRRGFRGLDHRRRGRWQRLHGYGEHRGPTEPSA